MESIDYAALYNEIAELLKTAETVVLATSADGKVTARTLNPLCDRTTIYFGTNRTSTKCAQIIKNPQVALVVEGMQIEARAELCGNPADDPEYSALYAAKYPELVGVYPPNEDDVVVKCVPTKIALFKYIDGAAWDVLLPDEKRAYRET